MSQSIAKRVRRVLRRFGSQDEGVTAIEFAIVGAPFIYLLCVMFEMGLMLFTEYTLENGVAEASRLIRTGQVQTQGISQSDFKQEVCDLAVFLDCEEKLFVDVRRYDDFESVTTPSSIVTDGGGNPELSEDITVNASFQPGDAGDVVVVRVYYDWHLFFPGIPWLQSMDNLQGHRRLLAAVFAFRNEPFTQ